MLLKEITAYLESLAPLSSQESYDNCGLITGNNSQEITGALISLDCTEAIIDDAIEKGCNLVISHHPIVFSGLKKLNGKNYVERTVIKAIKNDVAIYAIHTNLDNFEYGVNYEIAKRIGLKNIQILEPQMNTLLKLNVMVPEKDVEIVKKAIFEAGAGKIGDYDECAFETKGTGNFRPLPGSDPHIGEVNKREEVNETKLEILITKHQIATVLKALQESHPYEEVAYDLISLANANQHEGSGMIGTLPQAMDEKAFLTHIKQTFNCGIIRHTALLNRKISRVALCGGSGSFLLNAAKRREADIYLSADFKYHEFFDAEDQIVIADIGHYESEQFTTNLLADKLKKKFTNFAVHLTGLNTNPINYF